VAREVIEKLIDDLDGSAAAETVTFGIDGASYEIDLSRKNAAALRKALERYIGAARRRAGSRRSARRKVTSPSNGARSARNGAKASGNSGRSKRGFDIAQLREWAAANKVAVPARGRIPQAVVEQYKSAGGR